MAYTRWTIVAFAAVTLNRVEALNNGLAVKPQMGKMTFKPLSHIEVMNLLYRYLDS
jgi:hypothetical protein